MINNHCMDHRQEFTFLIIYICVQQIFIQFPRPAMQSADPGGQSPCHVLKEVSVCAEHTGSTEVEHLTQRGPKIFPR